MCVRICMLYTYYNSIRKIALAFKRCLLFAFVILFFRPLTDFKVDHTHTNTDTYSRPAKRTRRRSLFESINASYRFPSSRRVFLFYYKVCFLFLFNDISKRNNDYSDTPTSEMGEAGMATFFTLEVPGHKFLMLITYFRIRILYKNARYRSQIQTDFHEIHMVGASSIIFGNNRPNRITDLGENVPPKPVFRLFIQPVRGFLEKKT